MADGTAGDDGRFRKLRGHSGVKVGVLTVTFALAWEGDNVPEDEKNAPKRSARGNANHTKKNDAYAVAEIEPNPRTPH